MNDNNHWQVVAPATWPPPPQEMSVSTWAEIEECPRRWALSAAEYPTVWSGRGYPPKMQVAALAGSVVHLALEIIAKQLARAGVSSMSDPSASMVVRELGGYTSIVEGCVERILKRYVDNPRAGTLMEHARRTLHGQVPALRARVQSMLNRLKLSKGSPSTSTASTAPRSDGPPARLPLRKGNYPEVDVRARSIGWKGSIDLLVLNDEACEITDFKTGAADESHKFQVRAYAVMWRLDDELNPSGRVADRLVLSYESHDIDVAAPRASDIEDLARDLIARRLSAEAALAARPPSAHPNAETCRYCGVRQLCDAYWSSTTQIVSDDGRYGDVELKITGRHGPLSWDGEVVRGRDLPPKTPALLRLKQDYDFKKGARVRVLDAAIARDPEDGGAPAVVTLSVLSETYRYE
jgi:hypothetical protein